jgi:OPA family glycerol-3-phosphate transporter-like MFS transporter
MPAWLSNLLSIAILLVVITLVLARLPRVELGYTAAYRKRRTLNWLPLGLTYAFLYMGRYNLTPAKNALGTLMTKDDFAHIFSVGTLVYGISFLLNGPLTDRWGGRRTILIAALGTAACNVGMGLVLKLGAKSGLVDAFTLLYGLNMYFQSFGAVSIVKVNAHWFHVRERGVFGGIFGILISLGIYFAYDWSEFIVRGFPGQVEYVFFIPAAILVVFALLDFLWVFDLPSQTGHADVEVGDASSADAGVKLTLAQVAVKMFTNPVIVTITLIEFCSGYLRQSIMQWTPIFAKQTGIADSFVHQHWGMMLCVAGILGGVFAGTISDHLFQSRRGPVTVVLYAIMLIGGGAMMLALGTPALGWLLVFMSMAIIGVHGMLSGTASMDFGGKRNAGVAVGIIDGFVYLGTALEAQVLVAVLPKDGTPQAALAAEWHWWPIVMIPAALVGLLLALRLWHARPQPAH